MYSQSFFAILYGIIYYTWWLYPFLLIYLFINLLKTVLSDGWKRKAIIELICTGFVLLLMYVSVVDKPQMFY